MGLRNLIHMEMSVREAKTQLSRAARLTRVEQALPVLGSARGAVIVPVRISRARPVSARMRMWLRDPKVERWVSVVSLWEIAVKLQQLQSKIPPVTAGHTTAFLNLPMHHRDPFDRLLIAQAS